MTVVSLEKSDEPEKTWSDNYRTPLNQIGHWDKGPQA